MHSPHGYTQVLWTCTFHIVNCTSLKRHWLYREQWDVDQCLFSELRCAASGQRDIYQFRNLEEGARRSVRTTSGEGSQSEHGGMSTISWAPNGLLPIGAANAWWCEEARQDFEILQDTGQCVITRIPRGNKEQAVFVSSCTVN